MIKIQENEARVARTIRLTEKQGHRTWYGKRKEAEEAATAKPILRLKEALDFLKRSFRRKNPPLQ